uniref:Uncharacterized protein n=1 Tax=Physcomitrium patens TaxID=3218 RepID=A0A2K1K862_PHYPA|nr:hypothetical protein PHYPA_011863 [Physcomitrium patens]
MAAPLCITMKKPSSSRDSCTGPTNAHTRQALQETVIVCWLQAGFTNIELIHTVLFVRTLAFAARI